MTRHECQQLIDSYLDWLKRGITASRIDNACELTTPFLDRHNDHLQVYATRTNGQFLLSDDGYILSDLRTSGLDLNTPKRRLVIESILRGLGVRLENQRLVVEATERNLGQKVHSLVQAMLAVSDMFVMAQSRVESFFWGDVKHLLDSHDVRYSPRVKLSGKSGYDHAIDFLIPKSRKRPERLVQAINVPSRNTISAYLFTLADTREAREEESVALAFLNDRDHDVPGDVVEALEAYKVEALRWTARDQAVPLLAE
jgi:hypothetical protein